MTRAEQVAEAIGTYTQKLPAAIAKVRHYRAENILPYLRLPDETADIEGLKPLVSEFRRFKTVLVLGTGGSSLGGKTLYALKDLGFGNPDGSKLHFLDNVDPATFANLAAHLALKETGVLAISKSGSTAETLSQLLTLLPLLQHANPTAWAQQVVVITENTDNSLRALAVRHGIRTLEHDPKVGGRFSVLSVVGMLPALIAGVDAHAVRTGAKMMLDDLLSGNTENQAAVGAVWNMAHAAAGYTQTVLMPYSDQLADFGMWFRQLWGESLGKEGHGTTPIRAMGTVDQHSQLQLYLDGPRDKIFTVLVTTANGHGSILPEAEIAADKRLSYFTGRTMGDLLAAEQNATIQTLANHDCPVRVLEVGHPLDAASLGNLFMQFMLETILSAEMLGINAFDQPAVEEGKVLTRKFLAG